MRISKPKYHILFLLSLFLAFYSCKSDESNLANDSANNDAVEELEDNNLENQIDSSTTLKTDTKLDNVDTRQEIPINTTTDKIDNIQISNKIEQVGGRTIITDEKKYEKAIKNLPKDGRISVIELGKQSENKEEIINKEIPSTNTTNNNQPFSEPTDLHKHEAFNKLLQSYVSSSGRVNYKGIKSNEKELDSYLTTLSSNVPLDSWSRNEKMAYWINAYNAFTIKKILDNYPLKSILDLKGGKVWDEKFIKLGNKNYSLNEIENQILRPIYKDARIHFAVNCAAKSCPPLSNKAFTSSNLTQMLDGNSKDFINDSQYNTIAKGKSSISKIFDWYKSDFDDIVDFVNKYSNIKIDKNTQISYSDYDWRLNE
jgi:hypothetical protein